MSLNDERWMRWALEISQSARRIAPPNPWVGAVLVGRDGEEISHGATSQPGGAHAEVVALERAGSRALQATLYVTLEPCHHVGRTPPCTAAIVAAGVRRVVVAVKDPDPQVSGRGIAALREAGIDVELDVLSDEVSRELAPYLWHRRTKRPYVVLKVASTLDGRVAMVNGTSQWITSNEARLDAHEVRADSQAILVGAGTVRADDPTLTARTSSGVFEPLRVVLGRAPKNAKIHPCLERSGDLGEVLDELGDRGILQLLVEGGPRTASAFLQEGLVNRVLWYIAPAWAGSNGGLGALEQLRTETISDLRRGRILAVRLMGEDVRIDVVA
jgi:diaminohydroxyphosphoribosylaminopyrimidine deaminase/5-amino-6-(5-phosphoribosylamino)uracil reductase